MVGTPILDSAGAPILDSAGAPILDSLEAPGRQLDLTALLGGLDLTARTTARARLNLTAELTSLGLDAVAFQKRTVEGSILLGELTLAGIITAVPLGSGQLFFTGTLGPASLSSALLRIPYLQANIVLGGLSSQGSITRRNRLQLAVSLGPVSLSASSAPTNLLSANLILSPLRLKAELLSLDGEVEDGPSIFDTMMQTISLDPNFGRTAYYRIRGSSTERPVRAIRSAPDISMQAADTPVLVGTDVFVIPSFGRAAPVRGDELRLGSTRYIILYAEMDRIEASWRVYCDKVGG